MNTIIEVTKGVTLLFCIIGGFVALAYTLAFAFFGAPIMIVAWVLRLIF